MKAMLAAFAAMALIAIGSNMVLNEMGFSAQDRASGNAVRLDN